MEEAWLVVVAVQMGWLAESRKGGKIICLLPNATGTFQLDKLTPKPSHPSQKLHTTLEASGQRRTGPPLFSRAIFNLWICVIMVITAHGFLSSSSFAFKFVEVFH